MPLSDQQFLRYSRHLLMDDIAEQGQETLLNAHVLIVGLGGLGCPVSLYLAAAGIGKLSLCDADTIDTSNLQRQILYRPEDCGELKVACAKETLQALNSEVVINRIQLEVDKGNTHFGNWERIKRFELTPDVWSIDSGHLTPTMKMKREVIRNTYQDLYDKIYLKK